jgi:DNA-binding MarR family transcriptional regulator
MAARKHPRRPIKATPAPRRAAAVNSALEAYLSAWRWRRAVEVGLRALGLTFTQWLVLGATARAIAERSDAVNQSDVARLCELDRMTVSQVMRALDTLGLVDRAPGFQTLGYRIFLSRRGQETLELAEAHLVAVSPTLPSAGAGAVRGGGRA